MHREIMLFILIISLSISSYAQSNKIIVNTDQAEYKISRHIYGQFSEHLGRGIYEGIWVGENSDIPNTEGYRNDVLQALKELNIPNLRWPGGCFADEYHWKDGIGQRSERPKTINTHWGMVVEDNSFGTHEFLRLTELLETEPYISANVGSGTVKEIAQWIEYMTYNGDSEMANLRRKNGREKPWDIKFFGIGNESWGCGGNMTAQYYSDLYRRYATYAKDYSGNELFKIASGFSDDQYEWTETLMDNAGRMMDGLSLHYYTIAGPGWENKGPSVGFGEGLYFSGVRKALHLDRFIEGHSTRMDKYDPEKRVALVVDEWGIWTDPYPGSEPGFLYQQNSMRDALIAAVSLDILNSHADRVRVANIAQTVNVLQAMILTKGEKMIKTPTYHVFDMYQVHQDSKLLPHYLESAPYTFNGENIPAISATTSEDSTGSIHVTLSNVHPDQAQRIKIEFRGTGIGPFNSGKILTAPNVNSVNTFEEPDKVVPEEFDQVKVRNNELSIEIPSKSVIVLSFGT